MKREREKNESGMLIVEATMVFPMMFLIIFLMLFAGNAYLQKCRIEALVTEWALEGAARCANPLLIRVEEAVEKAETAAAEKAAKDGTEVAEITSISVDMEDFDYEPYRYLLGGMSDIKTAVQTEIKKKIDEINSGLFAEMEPILGDDSIAVDYNWSFLCSTFSVQVSYKIKLPVRLLGMDEYIYMNISTRVDVPVSDSPEFIKNVELAQDYMERFGVVEEIQNLTTKFNEWKDTVLKKDE